MKEKNLRNVKEWHPIAKKEVGFFANQEEWQEAWDKAETADELTGLLFRGLKISLDDEGFHRQICFYLEAAYGHKEISCFFVFGDRDYRHWTSFGQCTMPELKRIICSNAWKFLCQDFLKDQDEKAGEDPSWFYRLSADHRIIDKILWFFLEKDNCPVLHSVNDNNAELASKFLIRLAEYTWSSSQEGIRKYLISKRLEVMKILWNIGKLDFLLKRWEHLTQQDMDNLKELALIAEPRGSEHIHQTVEEATLSYMYGGGQAAKMYILLNTMLKEKARQDKIKETKRKIEEENQVLEDLKA